jgi:two-component system, OmpR family, copper resistance phosphate regulon response regulator CusR
VRQIPPKTLQILIAEDDRKTAEAVARGLQVEGFSPRCVEDGLSALQQILQSDFDAVVLDWMLPGLSGMEVIRRAREKQIGVPIILLTARDSVADRILGLESGADDYLVKPFSLGELTARLRAIVRRIRLSSDPSSTGPELVSVADLSINLRNRTVTRSGEPIALTGKEFELLQLLASNPNRIISRETLARQIWHGLRRATPLDNVIDVHIRNLRRKIDGTRSTKLIHTVRGVGFILRTPTSK